MSCTIYRPTAMLAMEAIEFQPKKDAEALLAIFAELHDTVSQTRTAYVTGAEIDKLKNWVKDRLGISISIVCDQYLAACLPLHTTDAHILSHPFWHGGSIDSKQLKWKRESDGKRGWVDLAKSKVGGIYSTHTHPVYMHFTLLVKTINLTARECAAIFLHEIGHLFTFFEFSDRMSTANQVLEQIAKEVAGNRNERAEHIFKLTSDLHAEINPKDIDLILSEDGAVAGMAFQSLLTGVLSSVIRDTRYAETASEQLADSFAVRWGFGRDLLVALDKMSVFMGDTAKSNTTLWILSLIEIAMAAIMALYPLILLPMPVGGPLAVLVVLFSLMLFNGHNNYKTYDNLRDRYKRMRNEIVAELKNDRLPKDSVKYALDSLDHIDGIIAKTGTGETFITRLMAVVSPWTRRTLNHQEFQRMLEDLAHNDMFVMSQRFKHQS